MKIRVLSDLRTRDRVRAEGTEFPVVPPRSELPNDYAGVLADIKKHIGQERLKALFAANSAMVLMYWDIGRTILERQERSGWGAKIIDRLSVDLRKVYPDMRGFSPRNLKYMRAFAAAWPDLAIVQRSVAQLPWQQNIALLERLDNATTRLWYAEQALHHGWSRPVLELQIDSKAHKRQGKAVNNFQATLPPSDEAA